MSGIERATYGAAFLVAITGLIGVVSAAIITAAVPYWRAGDADGDGPPSAPPTTSAITTPPSTTAEPTSPTSTMPLVPTTTPPFAGSPVELSASIAGRRTVEVTAEMHRPPRPGYAYWFVIEVHDVSNTHSEFYPRQNLTQAGSRFQINIPDDADLTRPRTGQVFEVPDEVSGRMESGYPDPENTSADYLLAPPCNCSVSNEVTLNFED
jgi:hypothetical protein